MMSKNMVEPEGPQMTLQYGAYALHTESARLDMHTHTHRQICNTYCFFTGTMICECASLLRYTCIVFLVLFLLLLQPRIYQISCTVAMLRNCTLEMPG